MVEHDLVPHRLLVQRAILGLAIVVLLLGCVAMLYAQVMSGFVDSAWVALAGAGAMPVFFVLLLVFVLLGKSEPAMSPASLSFHPQVPRRWLTLIGTLVLIGGITLITLSATVTVPALALGSHPARAAAENMGQGPPCRKCARAVWVDFRTADGDEISARLAGADGLAANDGRLTELVYDPVHPTHVMRQSDWRAGHSGNAAWGTFAGIAILIALVLAMIVEIRRRRRIFGDLRPGLPIVEVRSRSVRSGLAWKVGFGDQTSTSYFDSQAVRSNLSERIAAGSLTISTEDLRRLGEPFRRDVR